MKSPMHIAAAVCLSLVASAGAWPIAPGIGHIVRCGAAWQPSMDAPRDAGIRVAAEASSIADQTVHEGEGSSCYPDCTGDGVLTVSDFGCFQTRFAAGDPYADCNGDGILTVADFGCFQTRFVAGCP